MPTIVRSPSCRTQAAAVARVSSEPTQSITTSAPTPRVTSRIRSARSGPGARATSAPRCTARSRAVSRESTATTRDAVVARRTWTAMCPRPPTPMTTAVAVGPSLPAERRTAWYGVRAASVSGAASTGSSPAGSATRWRAAGTRRYSAIPPSIPSPPPPAGHRRQVRSLAVRLDPVQAVRAGTTAPGAGDRDRLADLEAADPAPEGVHPPGVLVAEGEGRVPGQHAGLELVHQVEVGVAGAGASHLEHHLAGSRLGDGNLLEDRFALPGHQSQCLHRVLLCAVRASDSPQARARSSSPSRRGPAMSST